MSLFYSGSSPVDRRFLDWKVWIFEAGAVLALAGIFLELRWMTWAAIVILLAGFGLRFVPHSPDGASEGEDSD